MVETKNVLISGVTGMDGSHLADLLLKKGYSIYGLVRRSSQKNYRNIQHLIDEDSINLIEGDLTDQSSLMDAIEKSKPDELYNMAAQSFVGTSWQQAQLTIDVTGLGPLRIMECIRHSKMKNKIRMLQASSITFDAPVLIRKDKEIKRTTFGDTLNLDNFEVLSIDRDSKEVKFLPIEKVLNHGEKEVFEIVGQTGLKIKVTSDHSVMVFDDNGDIVEKKTSDLQEGDCLITFVGDILDNKYNKDPIIRIDYEMGRGNNVPELITKEIKLTEELMRIIGIYMANGYSRIQQGNSGGTAYTVSFTFGNSDRQMNSIGSVIDIIWEVFAKEYSSNQIRDTSVQITYSSKEMYTFFSMFGRDARSKRLPPLIYSLPKNLVISLLNGYSFDAYLKPDGQIRYGTVNRELAIDINYLLRLNNISTYWIERYCEEHLSPQGILIKGTDMYDIETPIEDNIFSDEYYKHRISKTPMSRCLPPYIFKQENFYHLIQNSSLVGKNRIKKFIDKRGVVNNNIINIVNSNLGIVRIRYIRHIGKEMVGDYEIPGSECFFCGNQPILAHNSSEMFGNVGGLLNEDSPMRPRSPYGSAKLLAHSLAKVYRDSHQLWISCSICFNHTGERRGIEFVSQKIANGVAKIKLGIEKELKLGNIESRRDWAYAKDYIQGMWLMLQQEQPGDYILATGENHSVRDFVELAFNYVGIDNWKDYIKIDEKLIRPAEVYDLRGDYSKAKKELEWEPKTPFNELVSIMVQSELDRLSGKVGE